MEIVEMILRWGFAVFTTGMAVYSVITTIKDMRDFNREEKERKSK